ncbi:MAG: hypothetical protein OEY97_01075 [Nitrospirota bacterium]|nr:hypothetical protein [Nitrospirota bacterium]
MTTVWRKIISVALDAVVVMGFGAYSWAADLSTVNNTESYADPTIAAQFMTVPTDCTAAPDSIDTVTACNALGDLAVQAAQGLGPMGYWQGSSVTDLVSADFFVPSTNLFNLAAGGGGGLAPIFSKNTRNLFGRGDEIMGTFTREEMLFIGLALGVDAQQELTSPGDTKVQDMVIYLLSQPEGATSVTIGPLTFSYADLTTYTNITGFTSGKADTVVNNCLTNHPIFGALCGNMTFAATIYLADQGITEAFASSCGAGDPFCANRDHWIDQTVVGYVTSLDKDTAAEELTQNFRSQVSFDTDPLPISTINYTHVDQRLEQSVVLGMAEFEASRQTFQQAFQTTAMADFFWSPVSRDVSQLVSQDVEGYLFSCFNCDTPELVASGGSHAFDPWLTADEITFIPYSSSWHTVPTFTHAPVQ